MRALPRISAALPVLLFVTVLVACADSAQRSADTARGPFDDHLKTGELSLTIVGDYFHHSYVLELAGVARALAPDGRQVFICTEQYETALAPFLDANGVGNVDYHTVDADASILRQWARDIAVAGPATLVVSPHKQARTHEGAVAFAAVLGEVFPTYEVRVAPFVFEGGNVAFVRSGEECIVIVGRKVLFDNDAYQGRSWAKGHDADALLKSIAETFGADRVFVVGRARKRPPLRLYFEYHIDMGMVILEGGRAVVSRLDFGDEARESLAAAIRAEHPVTTAFIDIGRDELPGVLAERLEMVALEYEDYATLLDSLGIEVHRSPVGWPQVLGAMSWTNVVQVGNRILMPLYPDTLRAATESMSAADGRVRVSLDVSRIGDERFELTHLNESNRRLYERLGYDVVPVPEYLHYMMGGLHCFVNVLE